MTGSWTLVTEDSKEFQYVTRPEDNPPRQGDDAIALLLAIPLPLLFFGAICFGIKTHGRRKILQNLKASGDAQEGI